MGIAKTGKIGNAVFTPKKWDAAAPPKVYFDEMRRVSKAQIIWGGNYFANMLPASRCWLVWWKNDGLPPLTFADCEIAWTSFDKPARVFNCRWSGNNRVSKEPRVGHPTQKASLALRRGWGRRPALLLRHNWRGARHRCRIGRRRIGVGRPIGGCAPAAGAASVRPSAARAPVRLRTAISDNPSARDDRRDASMRRYRPDDAGD